MAYGEDVREWGGAFGVYQGVGGRDGIPNLTQVEAFLSEHAESF